MSKKNTNKRFNARHGSFMRNCLNCSLRISCAKIPHKNSIHRHREWCEFFLPDLERVTRVESNQAYNTIINPNSPSGQRAGIQATGALLGRVEDALNLIGKHD
jgi:hypothetical protein